VRNRLDDDAYTVRFTPRRPNRKWRAINIRRVHELMQFGRMKRNGLKAFAGAEQKPLSYSYEQRGEAKLEAACEKRFRTNKKAWAFFRA
jgi:uncharacterized protein YdeI (YjbR/CyaY-like superfamily)